MRRKKHIIVEGMDGTGKDTLIQSLMTHPDFSRFSLHARASTSLGGPVDDLAGWVGDDLLMLWKTRKSFIYNRHPLISEPIYGQVRPKKTVVFPFNNASWLGAHRRMMANHAVVVLCEPPREVVMQTLKRQGNDAHMPGVVDNADMLYSLYSCLMWTGGLIRYDYTAPHAFDVLVDILTRTVIL